MLVSENDLPINRDDEDGDVDKEAEATLDAALDPDKGGGLSTDKPLNMEEEKSASNWKEPQWGQPHSRDGHPDCVLELNRDTVNDPMEQEYMVLHAPRKNVAQMNPETETLLKIPGGPRGEEKRATEKTSESYAHQPLTEDLLLHHTHLEKLKVRQAIFRCLTARESRGKGGGGLQ